MHYNIIIKRQAKKILQKISRPDRYRITEKIMALGLNPDNPLLDIKPLEGMPYYRLRVGDWQIIYSRDNDLKIISIEKINPRGDVYK